MATVSLTEGHFFLGHSDSTDSFSLRTWGYQDKVQSRCWGVAVVPADLGFTVGWHMDVSTIQKNTFL